LGFGKKEERFFLNKMGQEYQRLGDIHTANLCFKAAEM